MIISANYQPQSRDTHPEVDKFLMQSFQQMSTCKKVYLVNEATKGIWQCSLIGIRNQYPNITTEQRQFQLATRWLGKEVAEEVLIHNREQLVEANIIKLALKMVDIFDLLKIPYLIGGSVASFILAEPRATLDVDMIADLQLSQVQPLVTIIAEEFYIDEVMIKEAIENKSSFNVIYLESMQKVDIFVLSDRPLAQVEMQRRQQLLITENPEKFAWLPSSEDIVLQKLNYRVDNEISDTQWRDVLGVLKVQADKLDLDYLLQWTETLNFTVLMTKAFQQAGIN